MYCDRRRRRIDGRDIYQFRFLYVLFLQLGLNSNIICFIPTKTWLHRPDTEYLLCWNNLLRQPEDTDSSTMVGPKATCLVPGCKNAGSHSLPKNFKQKTMWLKAMRLEGQEIKKDTRAICVVHFKETDFFYDMHLDPTNMKRRILKRTAVPSIFPWSPETASEEISFIATENLKSPSQSSESEKENQGPTDPLLGSASSATSVSEIQSSLPSSDIELDNEIFNQLNTSATSKTYSKQNIPVAFVLEHPELPYFEEEEITIDPLSVEKNLGDEHFANPDMEIGNNIEIIDVDDSITDEDDGVNAEIDIKKECNTENVAVCESCGQSTIPSYSVHSYKENAKAVHFYTGLESFAKLMFVFDSLGNTVNNLNYFYEKPPVHLDPLEQFCITLLILRRHREFEDIAMIYKTTIKQVTNIFITWIRFIALQWRSINLWIDRDAVSYYMPLEFNDKYPHTRVIIDATECPINKPHLPTAQQVTFSSYKNRNTIKFLIGMAPSGLITYISPCYGGSASDRQMIERSSILNKFDYNDEIMVDKGLNVQDIFLSQGVKVNMPTFFKKGNQINPETLKNDRKVASKRVHIERIIGMLKTFKILRQSLNQTVTLLSSDIVFIVAMLVNFRLNIMNKNALLTYINIYLKIVLYNTLHRTS